jgi:transposase
MPKVVKIKNIDQITYKINNFFSAHEDARFVRRLDVIALICNDHPIHYVAGLFGINPSTVQRWIHRINEHGFDGLNDKAGRGRRSQLNDADRLKLKDEIGRSPAVFGYTQSQWNGKLLSHHLKLHYGIQLKVRQCQYLFKQLGFSLQRPRKMPAGADPKKKHVCKKNSKRTPAS